MVKIAPSILAANYDKLEEEIKSVVDTGADMIHVDVMDGKFVKNKTPGMEMYTIAKKTTHLPVDTHLMVENPEEWIDNIIAAHIVRHDNNDIISFHVEAVNEITAYKIINKIHDAGIKAGIAIKPDTRVEEVMPLLPIIDMVLVMTVEPGYGGQALIERCLKKVIEIRELEPDLDIEVDGGINLETIEKVKNAGANVIVAGTAIFNAEDRKKIIEALR